MARASGVGTAGLLEAGPAAVGGTIGKGVALANVPELLLSLSSA